MAIEVLYVGEDSRVDDRLQAVVDDVSVITAASREKAETLLANRAIDFVLAGYDLPDGTGFDVFRHVQKRYPDTPVVVFGEDVPEDKKRQSQHVLEYNEEFIEAAFRRLGVMIESAVDMDVPTLYPLPEDEEQRLELVAEYDVAGMDAEESFERITHIAQELFDVEMTFFGIVGKEEEELFACQGMDDGTVPREESICTFTILEDAVMVVEDTQEDDRFSENELLEEMDVRWYAGAPLITPDGARIGTLCLMDTEPREFPEEDEVLLDLLADELAEQLRLRKRLIELEG